VTVITSWIDEAVYQLYNFNKDESKVEGTMIDNEAFSLLKYKQEANYGREPSNDIA
jgi:hypothetical protein